MAYQVLALKWRPSLFEQVVAQDHVTRTLQNAISSGRIANAYLFSGPRGVGKTTTARIFAKALNCKEGPTPTPCNTCTNCLEIAGGRSMDVIEIDGASNRGIDEIRNLRENIRYAPSNSRYKIYIVDEVHMLTTEAFNALLKTLEEPPQHVVFIFATTEPHKVPATILSRCQRFDFKRIPLQVIIDHLKFICEDEKIGIDEESLLVIAKKADGSMRDAQSLLDQIISFSGETVVIDDVLQALGVIQQDLYFEFTDIVKSQSIKKALDFIDRFIAQGYDISGFLMGLVEHLRNKLFVLSMNSTKLLEVSEASKTRYLEEKDQFSEEDLLRFIQVISETEATIKRSSNPRLKLEIMAVKLIKMDRSVTISDLVEKISKIGAGKKGALLTGESHNPPPKVPDFFGGKSAPPPSKVPPRMAQPQKAVRPVEAEGSGNQLQNEGGEETDEPSSLRVGDSAESYSAAPVTDLKEIQSRWNEILEAVKRKKMTLGFFLQEGYPIKLTGNTLEIMFDKSNGFHLNAVQKERDILTQVLADLLNQTFSLKFSRGTLDAAAPKAGASDEPARAAPVKKNGLDPKVQKILQMFDGELL
ncbi:MAG: DNA polymerase III subunit gamma/tau [Calditrichaeota bacterium]|nr:DNA polymerase III subunit gamma/tau [Calditrichota bacterium]